MMPGDNRPDYFFCIKSLHNKNNTGNVRALGRYALHFLDSAQMTIHLPSKQDRLQRANRVPQTRVAVLAARMHTFD